MANFVDYEKRLEQLDVQKMNLINRRERADRKAYDEAAFYIGKRILSCFNDDQEKVNYDGIEELCKALIGQINNPKTRDIFWVDCENTNPGYNLSCYKDILKKRNKVNRRYERITK